MTENEQIVGWDDAISSGNYVKFEKDDNDEYKEKVLKLQNWHLVKCEKFGQKDVVEFRADVIEEDGKPVDDKLFTSVSNRLKIKLKNILSNKDPKVPVKVSILPIGEDFARQYSAREVPN